VVAVLGDGTINNKASKAKDVINARVKKFLVFMFPPRRLVSELLFEPAV
jgi:hypothetical protein